MNITKGALIVIKRQKVSTLYRLIGNSIVGRVAVTTSIESSVTTQNYGICNLAILVNMVC